MKSSPVNDESLILTQELTSNGIDYLPVRDDKRPPEGYSWGGTKGSFELIEKYRKLGATRIGIKTGSPSRNLEVIDEDAHKVSNEISLLRILSESVPEIYERLCIAQSRSGGHHIYYRVSDHPVPGNHAIAKNSDGKILFETRGEGGYIIVWNEEMIQGDWTEIPDISWKERERIHEILRLYDESGITSRSLNEDHIKALKSIYEGLPSDNYVRGFTPELDFDKKFSDWGSLLGKYATIVYEDDQKIHFKGKTSESPRSGNIHKAKNILFNFSESLHEIPSNTPLTPSAVLAYLNFDGDFFEMRKYLSKEGYGMCIVQDDALELPLDVLPDRLQENVIALEEKLGYHAEFSLLSMLVSASLAIGNSVFVIVKTGWVEHCALWGIIAAPSSTGKSHPMTHFFRYHNLIDSASRKKYDLELKKFNDYNSLSKTEKKDHPKIEKPYLVQRIFQDSTPEAQMHGMKYNYKGTGLISDEALSYFKNANRYADAATTQDMCTLWNGSRFVKNRVSGESFAIERPFVTFLGSIQPRLLKELAGKSRLDSGLTHRILFICLDNAQVPDWNDKELSHDQLGLWNEVAGTIERLNKFQMQTVNTVRLTNEAKTFFAKWKNEKDALINSMADGPKREFLGKFDNHLIRLCLILQVLNDVDHNKPTDQIELKAVQGAARLVEFFKAHGLKALSYMIGSKSNTNSRGSKSDILFEALPNSRFRNKEAIDIAERLGVSKRTAHRLLEKAVNHGDIMVTFDGDIKYYEKGLS